MQWQIVDIQGEVFTLMNSNGVKFQTTIMGAATMNLFNLKGVLQSFCDGVSAQAQVPVGDLSTLIGAKLNSLG